MSTELNGRYKAKAKEWGLGETNSGNIQVGVLFELTEPGAEGQRIAWYGGFTEKGAPITFRALRTMGWVGSDVTELDAPAAALNTNEVELVIEPETYEGKTTTKVKWVNEIGAGGVALKNRLSPEKKASFAADMKGRLLAFDQKNKSSRSPPASHPAAKGFDDIPF